MTEAKKETPGTVLWGMSLILPVAIFRAFAFSKIWLWHVVPVVHVAPLSVGHVLGILIGVSAMREVVVASDPSKQSKSLLVTILWHQAVWAAMVLLIAWVGTIPGFQ